MKTVSVGFIVINNKEEILLGKVSNHNPPFQWTVFKGGVEGDEEMIDTAIRELKEETGIDLATNHNLNKYISSNFVFQYHLSRKDVYLFTVEDKEGELDDFEFTCDSYWGEDNNPEIADYKWVKIKDLHQYMMASQRGLADFLKIYEKGA